MQQPYISFSDRMVRRVFEIRLPEYYTPNLPSYYRGAIKTAPPMLNGMPVTPEEYFVATGISVHQDAFTPAMIYETEDDNIVIAMRNTTDLIDLIANRINFSIVNQKDIPEILSIMNGYVEEISPYRDGNKDIDSYILKLRNAFHVLHTEYEAEKQRNPHKVSGPINIFDIFQKLKGTQPCR